MINESQIILFLLVLARVSTFVAFFPLFSRRQLPTMVKVGLACALSFFWYSTIEGFSNVDSVNKNIGTIASIMLIAKEVTIGLILAVTLGLFFLPARIAGSYIGQELGLSLASISDPGSQDSSTLVSRIIEAFAILIFFSINLHHFVILVVHHSFDRLMGKIDILTLPTEKILNVINEVNDYGLLIVAPVAILFMLITVGLAYLNKAAPTLNLFSVGMSIRSGFGILCLLIFCPAIFGAVQGYMYRMQADIEQILVSFQLR